MLSSGVMQASNEFAQAVWVAGVQLGMLLRQFTKSLIFCLSASEQWLLL